MMMLLDRAVHFFPDLDGRHEKSACEKAWKDAAEMAGSTGFVPKQSSTSVSMDPAFRFRVLLPASEC